MSFISLAYLVFLPLVVLVHYWLPVRNRWAWLLVVSCYFYAVFIPKFLLVLAFIIAVDYTTGRVLENPARARRRAWLGLSLGINLAVLVAFKYFDFFNDQIAAFAHLIDWQYSPRALHLVLPLGLSFHTFQSMSYTLEVYHGRQPAERHFGIYALYVMFFPQLVAGPIERPQNLLPQFHRPRVFNSDFAVRGLRLILWGVFKKVVLADRLAILVDGAYGGAWELTTGTAFLIATVAFAFQIYYDFSAYTDIARGSARLLGVELMRNFDFPYFAASPAEFWRRWHISLSTWFRDYLYIPLGGNRGSRARTGRNLLLVFAFSGLWHGANLTFLIWGLIHFIYVAAGLYARAAGRWWASLPRAARVAVNFALISLAWVFFRASSVEQAGAVLSEMLMWHRANWASAFSPEVRWATALVALTTVGEFYWAERTGEARFLNLPAPFRWMIYYALIAVIFGAGVFSQNQFIYFQF